MRKLLGFIVLILFSLSSLAVSCGDSDGVVGQEEVPSERVLVMKIESLEGYISDLEFEKRWLTIREDSISRIEGRIYCMKRALFEYRVTLEAVRNGVYAEAEEREWDWEIGEWVMRE